MTPHVFCRIHGAMGFIYRSNKEICLAMLSKACLSTGYLQGLSSSSFMREESELGMLWSSLV